MDDYDDVHRLQFDLETGFTSSNAIFQIGIRDNRGFEGFETAVVVEQTI
jgi:hypothetical protein